MAANFWRPSPTGFTDLAVSEAREGLAASITKSVNATNRSGIE